ncbi:transposable element Tcb2 transposase [Trichonephila clavipes]|nr:transposable element Tcb2 transposase [Trichonephila clavipes]
MLTEEFGFDQQRDDKWVRVWKGKGTCNRPENIIKHHAFDGGSTMVWTGISLRYRTELHIYRHSSVTAERYRDQVLHNTVKLYATVFCSF